MKQILLNPVSNHHTGAVDPRQERVLGPATKVWRNEVGKQNGA